MADAIPISSSDKGSEHGEECMREVEARAPCIISTSSRSGGAEWGGARHADTISEDPSTWRRGDCEHNSDSSDTSDSDSDADELSLNSTYGYVIRLFHRFIRRLGIDVFRDFHLDPRHDFKDEDIPSRERERSEGFTNGEGVRFIRVRGAWAKKALLFFSVAVQEKIRPGEIFDELAIRVSEELLPHEPIGRLVYKALVLEIVDPNDLNGPDGLWFPWEIYEWRD